MESPGVLILILVTITSFPAPAYSHDIYATENPVPVGGRVTLYSTVGVPSGIWMFGSVPIVVFFPGEEIVSNSWKDKITFNKTANQSSLTISPVTLEDSGEYSLVVINAFTAKLILSVQVPVSNVTLRAKATDLVEFNDTAVLVCSAANGTSLSYRWMEGSTDVTDGRGVNISAGGATLSIVGVSRDDEGPFRCIVSNGISNGTSSAVSLDISYGPSNPTMTLTPMKSIYRTGSDITLSCSAESKPPAVIQWMLNGVYLNISGPRHQLMKVTNNTAGNYQCIFHNAVTLRFRSADATIVVMAPIAAAVVNDRGEAAILNATFTLHCEVTGRVDSIRWLKERQPISPDSTISFGVRNKTLTFQPVQLSDNGDYQCQAFNYVSNMTSSSYSLEVNYGPMKPVIMGPSLVQTGTLVRLTCSSVSHPPSHFRWYFNGSLVATTSELTIGNLTSYTSRMYICMAFNTITGKNSTAYKILTVLAPIAAAVVNDTGEAAILNATFTLHCEVTGRVDSIRWLKEGQPISPDSTISFGVRNKTLTFKQVQLSDNGDYQCQAFNYVSNMTSSSYSLEVNYGPMKPVIMGPSLALTGSQVTLTCSSVSNPPSHYRWYFNGGLVASTSELTIWPPTSDLNRKYICMAFNTITGENSTAHKILTVLAPVTMASVKVVGAGPYQNRIFTLTCETAGDVESITWMLGLSPLYANSTRNLTIENGTLTFDPVMHSDNGDYRCVASNPLSSFASPIFTLQVYYGPDVPTITGPDVALTTDIITLICSASSYPPSVYRWHFNDAVVANRSEYVTPPLTKDMSGIYTCVAYNDITGINSSAHTTLTVEDPILEAHVEAPMEAAIEGYDYNLTCIVTGTAKHFSWIKNGELLHGDSRIVFDQRNRTVIFTTLDSTDTGKYECIAMNGVWNRTSPPYNLLVNFGPEAAMIDGPDFAQIGQTVVYHCSAKSVPPSQFSWWYNGSMVANTSVFTTDPLSFNMMGGYTCVAYNDVTMKNSTSSKILTVIDKVSPMIRSNTVPINSANFTLICELTGPSDKIHWMKNSKPLKTDTSTADGATSYHFKDNMLIFTPVTVADDGTYLCVVTNQLGPHTSPPYTLLVNYGPLSVTISGPVSAKTGQSVNLRCSADSRPECDFHWFFNNQSSPLKNGSAISFIAERKNEGNYTCEARNPVTNIIQDQTRFLTISHAAALHIPSFGVLMLLGLFALSATVLHS